MKVICLSTVVVVLMLGNALPAAGPELLDGLVNRTVGQTSVIIRYGSPSAGERTIWGDVVPFGEDWGAGGGKSTTIQFDEHVQINGNLLPAGIYTVHVHPISDEDWQLVFSRTADARGDRIDSSQEVLRISVTPEAAEHRDRLKFGLEGVAHKKPFKATLYLHWEKRKVAVSIRMTGRLPSKNIKPEIPPTATEPWNVVRHSVMSLAAEEIERAVEDFAEDFETDFGDGGGTAAYVQLMNNLRRGGLLEEMEINFDDLVVEMDDAEASFNNIGVRAPFGDSRLNYHLERRDDRWQVISILSSGKQRS